MTCQPGGATISTTPSGGGSPAARALKPSPPRRFRRVRADAAKSVGDQCENSSASRNFSSRQQKPGSTSGVVAASHSGSSQSNAFTKPLPGRFGQPQGSQL